MAVWIVIKCSCIINGVLPKIGQECVGDTHCKVPQVLINSAIVKSSGKYLCWLKEKCAAISRIPNVQGPVGVL